MNSGIYIIANTINGKVYVGSTNNFERRWGRHKDELRHGKHFNPHLQSSWNKYGEGVFEFSILEYVDSLDKLVEAEQFWMDIYREEGKEIYNFGLAADCPRRGLPHTDETKRKMSKAKIGNTNTLGHIRSKETKRKMSRAKKGKPSGHLGKKHSEETKRKMSKAKKAYWARVKGRR